ncbi:hypothetical protein [Chthonobacter rhizosphaerae]|nr:hypothetical protein [Chthonobacter rhizosphaerae]
MKTTSGESTNGFGPMLAETFNTSFAVPRALFSTLAMLGVIILAIAVAL